MRFLIAFVLVFLSSLPSVQACQIPVFRFALERWQADLFEVSVFFEGPLDADTAMRLDQLENEAVQNGGTANYEVVRCNLKDKVPADLLSLWQSIKGASLPYVIVRTPRGIAGQKMVWHGRLADPYWQNLSSSPIRKEVLNRLLRGDAVVWLLIRGSDKAAADQHRHSLETSVRKLEEEIQLPLGIGKPGSELRTNVPLRIKFSIVEMASDSAAEQAFKNSITAHLKQPLSESESLAIPIFGRGRALEILRSKEIESEAIQDLTEYLCGACSCQVKQQNPGFDLLLAMNWEERLFEPGFVIPMDEPNSELNSDEASTLIAIPPGNGSGHSVITSIRQASPSTGKLTVSRTLLSTVFGFAVLLAITVFRRL